MEESTRESFKKTNAMVSENSNGKMVEYTRESGLMENNMAWDIFTTRKEARREKESGWMASVSDGSRAL